MAHTRNPQCPRANATEQGAAGAPPHTHADEYCWISKQRRHPLYRKHTHPALRELAQKHHVEISILGPDDESADAYVRAIEEAAERRVAGLMVVGWDDAGVVAAIHSFFSGM